MRTFGIDDIAAAAAWLVAGGHPGIALRATAHAPSVALCRAFGDPIVSTSTNRHGAAPARSAAEIRVIFGAEPDGMLDASLGGLACLTPITGAASGAIIRA